MIYPVVVVLVEGVQCRALPDTGAGSSYAAAALLQQINKQPVRTEYKRIDMMMCSTTQRISVYNLTVRGVDGKFELQTTVNKVDKGVLLKIPNPWYTEIIKKYDHLTGVVIEDNDTKSELPIHMILYPMFYIPHKPVVRENAETTKVRIVFDASAKANEDSPSLNECLETGPPIQNLLWDVLVRNRVKPIALAGDIKQAFLQVRIIPEYRNALRFHWIKNKDPSAIEVLRLTRALFGLVQSPFLLGGTLKVHLNKLKEAEGTISSGSRGDTKKHVRQ